MIPFDPSTLPQLSTRKALLVLDFQNDFLSPEGALPATEPDGFVDRTLKVAEAFRRSGSGEVIWVKSEFAKHRAVKEEQIIVADNPILPSHHSTSSSRSRKQPPATDDQLPDADSEAFLSRVPDEAVGKPVCVLPGTTGVEMPAKVSDTMGPKDFMLTKNDYSAFETPQLLKRLRARFITELYICGALTNISVYATALDAGRHGLALTLIEDCCGYRGVMRHTNAVRRLIQLTGCDTLVADDAIASISATPTPPAARSQNRRSPPGKESAQRPPVTKEVPATDSAKSGPGRETTVDLPLRTRVQGQNKVVGREPGTGPKNTASAPLASHDDGIDKAPVTSTNSQATKIASTKLTTDDVSSARNTADSAKVAKTEPTSNGKEKAEESTSSPKGLDWLDILEADPNPLPEDDQLPALKFKRADQVGRRGQDAVSEASNRIMKPLRRSPSGSAREKKGSEGPITPPPRPSKDGEHRKKAAVSPVKSPIPAGDAKHADSVSHRDAIPATSQSEVKERKEASAPTSDTEEDSETSSSAADSRKGPTCGEKLCEGDTRIFYNVLPPSIEDGVFERLRDEVKWLRMAHQGGEVPRLVCIQGQVDEEGNMPVYRHPSDESPPLVPFTTTVVEIKSQVEKILGHSLNHVLIQLYRDGNDYISEHSDKTLDIVKGSFICNVSLGAERTMTFRTKRPDKDPSRDFEAPKQQPTRGPKREVTRARLPHNSLCRMGLETNMRWLHAIRQDKRRHQEKDPAELAFAGGRISLTFRHIGTYLNRDNTLIWGQGAVSKSREGAQAVINGQTPEAIKMLQAFGTENHSSTFAWDKYYGEGFNVLHMSNAPRFFSSSNTVVNMRIQLILAEAGIGYAKGSVGHTTNPGSNTEETGDAAEALLRLSAEKTSIRFADNDPGKSVVEGDVAIMLYLDGVRSRTREKVVAPPDLARRYTRFQQALALLDKWTVVLAQVKANGPDQADNEDGKTEEKRNGRQKSSYCKPLQRDLAIWNKYAAETADDGFIAGGEAPSLADFALWPVLHDMQEAFGGDEAFAANLMSIGCKDLLAYYLILATRSCVKRVLKGATEP